MADLCASALAPRTPKLTPSIGDHAASRAPFQIAIALTAAPRFALLALQWVAHRYPPRGRSAAHALSRDSSPSAPIIQTPDGLRSRKHEQTSLPDNGGPRPEAEVEPAAPAGWADIEAMCGLGRTFCCGGWMFITSRDQHGTSPPGRADSRPARPVYDCLPCAQCAVDGALDAALDDAEGASLAVSL